MAAGGLRGPSSSRRQRCPDAAAPEPSDPSERRLRSLWLRGCLKARAVPWQGRPSPFSLLSRQPKTRGLGAREGAGSWLTWFGWRSPVAFHAGAASCLPSPHSPRGGRYQARIYQTRARPFSNSEPGPEPAHLSLAPSPCAAAPPSSFPNRGSQPPPLLHPRMRRTRAPVLTGGPGAAPRGVASKGR